MKMIKYIQWILALALANVVLTSILVISTNKKYTIYNYLIEITYLFIEGI